MASTDVERFVEAFGGAESTRAVYRYQLGQLEAWHKRPLAKASERSLTDLKQVLRTKASGPQYAKLLRMLYKSLDREDLRKLCVIRQRVKRLGPQDVLTLPEVQAIVDHAPSVRDRALIAVLWETGVRIHELVAVKLKDVREKAENGGKVYIVWFGKAKVPGEEHDGYVLEASKFLEGWLRVHPDPQPDAPLFVGWGNKPLRTSGARDVVQGAAKAARVAKRVYPHLFRHSRATHLLRIGVPEAQVKKLLGWKPNSPMLGRYAHLVDRDAYAALLKAHGIPVPEAADLGRLRFDEASLKPVVPMVAPPNAGYPAGPTGIPWDPAAVREMSKLLEEFKNEDPSKFYAMALASIGETPETLKAKIRAVQEAKGVGP